MTEAKDTPPGSMEMSEARLDEITAQLRGVYCPSGSDQYVIRQAADLITTLRAQVQAGREALGECEAYFESRADAEYSTDRAAPSPNEEMRLLDAVKVALRHTKGSRP